MSATGHLHSKNASIQVKVMAAGCVINLSGHGNSCDFEFNSDQLEATSYGDSVHTSLDGLTVFSISVNSWWAGSAPTGAGDTDSVAACMMSLVGKGEACTPVIRIAPAGSNSGSIQYIACVNVQATPMAFPVDNIATMNFAFTARAGCLTASPNSASQNWG